MDVKVTKKYAENYKMLMLGAEIFSNFDFTCFEGQQ